MNKCECDCAQRPHDFSCYLYHCPHAMIKREVEENTTTTEIQERMYGKDDTDEPKECEHKFFDSERYKVRKCAKCAIAFSVPI